MGKVNLDKRSLVAQVFVRDRPEFCGCFSPTEQDMQTSFRDDSMLLWNRGAVFYGNTPEIVPAIYTDTTHEKALRVLKQFHDFENRDYRYHGDFPTETLRSAIEAQKKAAKAAHRRRLYGHEFWLPYVIWTPGQRALSFDPDMLSWCCTLLGDTRITLWLPTDNTSILPIKLSNSCGVIYILPVRT